MSVLSGSVLLCVHGSNMVSILPRLPKPFVSLTQLEGLTLAVTICLSQVVVVEGQNYSLNVQLDFFHYFVYKFLHNWFLGILCYYFNIS